MRSGIEWALVADAERARILERPSHGAPWAEREAAEFAAPNPPSHQHGSDRPGRVRESVGTARHAMEPRQDPHDAAKLAFARHVADRLEAAATAGQFAHLLIVAPPAFLGQLRQALGDATRPRVIGSLNKDLAHETLREVVAHLETAFPI